MKKIIYSLMVLVPLVTSSCVKRVDNSEQTRADYERTLSDSIAIIKQEIDSCNDALPTLRDKVGVMMTEFTTVANPREVGSYTLPSNFVKRYPPAATALVARLDENGNFELVGALSGKAFDQITVKVPEDAASTDVVPHDQALNYRSNSLTTVMFSGEAAQNVGALIADNELNPITVIYQQNGTVQSWKLPTDYANEISSTYRLFEANSEINRLERRVSMLNEKIKLIRIHLERK